MSKPTTATRIVRTRAIAALVRDVALGAAISRDEAHERLGVQPNHIGEYMQGIWDEIPAPALRVGPAAECLTLAEVAIVRRLAEETGRFVLAENIPPGHCLESIKSHISNLRRKGVPIVTWTDSGRFRGYAIDGREALKAGILKRRWDT
jgi:hypothetical protein